MAAGPKSPQRGRRVWCQVHRPTGEQRVMDGPEPDDARVPESNRLPLWIIEYVWAHGTVDLRDVVDPSSWPELDSGPLSLRAPWRLRVSSAEVHSIVRRRAVERFEKVTRFLEATDLLLPGLVAPIKHMKVMFGLKTMVVMRMLREGRGAVETVLKTIQFFPCRLPQYHGRCSRHAMFLMRKNHLDFKLLAQALALDQDKLADYMKAGMEQQYGEHYAQKVEDRLLHYLQQLEAALPGDTYIDTLLKKTSPVTQEEKLLLDVVTSDPAAIATALERLLHCDAASCRPGSGSSAHGRRALGSAPPSKALLQGGKGVEPEEPQGGLPENANLKTERDVEVVGRSSEEDGGDEGEEGAGPRGGGGGAPEASTSPQFCSKHRRWVRSILQECPDEPPLRAHASSSSPPLFPSSSSAASSQDLTPSGIVPPDQTSTSTSTHLQTAGRASAQVTPEDRRRSGSQREPPPRPAPHGGPTGDNPQVASAPSPRLLTSPPRRTPGSDATQTSSSRRSGRLRRAPAPRHLKEASASPPQGAPKTLRRPRAGGSGSRGVRRAAPGSARSSPALRLQPYVRLHRLSAQDCCRRTTERCSTRWEEEEEDEDVSFDVNALYSGGSSGSDGAGHCDPEYKPRFKKKRLL